VTERHFDLGAVLADHEHQHHQQRDACRCCEDPDREPRDHRRAEQGSPGSRASTVLLPLEILERLSAVLAHPQMGFQRDTLRQADVPVEERGETLVSFRAVHGNNRPPRFLKCRLLRVDDTSETLRIAQTASGPLRTDSRSSRPGRPAEAAQSGIRSSPPGGRPRVRHLWGITAFGRQALTAAARLGTINAGSRRFDAKSAGKGGRSCDRSCWAC
jgi:hypothetical protein